jgi:hypothetical protein
MRTAYSSHYFLEEVTRSGNEVKITISTGFSFRNSGNFLADIFLVQGTHIINLEVTNPDKKTTTIQKTINVKYPLKKPTLIVTMPEEPGFISVDKVKINGFTDVTNIIEVYNNFYNTNGQEILSLMCTGNVDGQGRFLAEVRLNPGPNKLTIRAIHPNGSVTEEIRKIYCKNNLDLSWGVPVKERLRVRGTGRRHYERKISERL